MGDASIGVGGWVVDLWLNVGDLEVLAVAELGEHLLMGGSAQLEVVVVDTKECERAIVAAHNEAVAVGRPREGGGLEVHIWLVDMRCFEFVTEEKSELRRTLLVGDEPQENDALVAHGHHNATVEGVEVTDSELAIELSAGDGVSALVTDHGVGAHVLELEFTLVLQRQLVAAHVALDLLRE